MPLNTVYKSLLRSKKIFLSHISLVSAPAWKRGSKLERSFDRYFAVDNDETGRPSLPSLMTTSAAYLRVLNKSPGGSCEL